jgi:hypothetical protein
MAHLRIVKEIPCHHGSVSIVFRRT